MIGIVIAIVSAIAGVMVEESLNLLLARLVLCSFLHALWSL